MSRKQAARIVFLVVMLMSLISMGKATVDYVGVYAALNQLDIQPLSFDWSTNTENINVVVDLKVLNPTWYGDLRLTGIISTLYYEGENHTVIVSPGGPMVGTPFLAINTTWWELPETETIINRPLTTNDVIKIKINFTISGKDRMHFQEFYEKIGRYQEYISWRLESRVYLNVPTFIKSIGLEYQFYLQG